MSIKLDCLTPITLRLFTYILMESFDIHSLEAWLFIVAINFSESGAGSLILQLGESTIKYLWHELENKARHILKFLSCLYILVAKPRLLKLSSTWVFAVKLLVTCQNVVHKKIVLVSSKSKFSIKKAYSRTYAFFF